VAALSLLRRPASLMFGDLMFELRLLLGHTIPQRRLPTAPGQVIDACRLGRDKLE
jgi:hypothetical protein